MRTTRFFIWLALASAVLSPIASASTPALAASSVEAGTQREETVSARQSSTVVAVTVLPWHLAVLDRDGHIAEVWSNTDLSTGPLIVKLGSLDGPQVESTPQVLAEYEAIRPSIVWLGNPGRVYVAPPSLEQRLTGFLAGLGF